MSVHMLSFIVAILIIMLGFTHWRLNRLEREVADLKAPVVRMGNK